MEFWYTCILERAGTAHLNVPKTINYKTMTNIKKRIHRTTDDLIAEKLAQIAKLQTKQNIENAKENEILDPITALINEGRKKYTAASHHFSTGPQSFKNRLYAYSLKTNEVMAEKDLQESYRDFYKVQKEYYLNVLSEASEMVASENSEEDIVIFINEQITKFNEETPNNHDELIAIRDETLEARKEFMRTRKIPEVPEEIENTEE